ncbi:gamma subclass chorismate mutase AroQ [Bacillus subtilis subsp. subtilis]|nr:gamma subclass chorismate mutase AroQ [Bacillus subtilis subsp. subtilis]
MLLTLRGLICIVLGALSLPASATTAPLSELIDTIVARNAIGHAVAASKYPQDRPVEDRQREQVVLAAKREQARARGLDPDAVVAFHAQLIEANKLIQHMDYQRFRLGNAPPVAPSLEVLRRRIDAVDQRMLSLWEKTIALAADPACTARVAAGIGQRLHSVPRLSGVEATALVRALVGFCQHDGRAWPQPATAPPAVAGAQAPRQDDAAGH